MREVGLRPAGLRHGGRTDEGRSQAEHALRLYERKGDIVGAARCNALLPDRPIGRPQSGPAPSPTGAFAALDNPHPWRRQHVSDGLGPTSTLEAMEPSASPTGERLRAENWDRFFEDFYPETAMLSQLDSEAEARAAMKLADCDPGADVLDCPCGQGRHAIPLAKMGYRVTASDRSPSALTEVRKRSNGREWPRCVNADYRRLPFANGSFDVVINLFTGVGYYGDAGDRAVFAEACRVLRRPGTFVLEAMHRDRLMSDFREQNWYGLPGGALLLDCGHFDHVAGMVDRTQTLIRSGGERVTARFRLRVYTATEIGAMLHEAGFMEVEFFGGLIEHEPLSAQRKLVAVARAP
jgi:SAM-dependent methyltransferase